jgi:malate/lactate dehydrogenase
VREVAIIGAGNLGGAVAHLLAERDAVRTVTLIDDGGRAAAGKALDIAEAAPIETFSTRVDGTADLSRAAGASVIVIADRFGSGGEWEGEEALMLLKRMAGTATNAVILCAGAAQRELIDRGVGELKLASGRLFGTAPEAFAGGVRALIALAGDGSPLDVSIAILGVPPSHTVIAWEDATIGGFRLTSLIDEPARRRLAARIVALWPPGPHALAAAAVKAIDVMAGRSRRTVTCFVGPDRAAGIRTRAAAFPVRLGPTGIVQLVTPSLSVAERVALENAISL